MKELLGNENDSRGFIVMKTVIFLLSCCQKKAVLIFSDV